MTDLEYSKSLEDALEDLQEDAELIRIVLLGAGDAVDELTLRCMLRLSDYLKQHINDVEMLLKGPKRDKKTC